MTTITKKNAWGGRRSYQPGRPPLPEGKRRVKFNTSVNCHIYKAVKTRSESEGVSVGVIIDRAIPLYDGPGQRVHYPRVKASPYLAPQTAETVRKLAQEKRTTQGFVLDDALALYLEKGITKNVSSK